MSKSVFLALLLVSLAGCVMAPQYGNFIPNTASANDKKIAGDVVKKLVALYPPASTRFDMQHATPDFFGTYLVESMHAKGYAVLEFKAATAASAELAPVAPSSAGLSLSYVMDQAKDSDLYRVTLVINHEQSLARVYQLQDGTIYPAGYWVRKE